MNEMQCASCQKLQQRVAELEAQTEQLSRAGRPRWPLVGMLLFLGVAALCAILMVWALTGERQARTAEQDAIDDRDQARKAEAESKRQLDVALSTQQVAAEQRDAALKAKEEAQHSTEDARAALAFLQNNVFSPPGHPMKWGREKQDKNVTLRQVVDEAASKVAEAFANRPLVRASVREILGAAYLELDEADKAVEQYERALALREDLQGFSVRETVDCRNNLAMAYRDAGHPEKASALFDQDSASPSYAAELAIQGSLLLAQKKPVEAELKLRRCLAIYQQTKPNDWATFEAQALLGTALLEQKKYKQAEPLLLAGYKGMKQHPSRDKVRRTKTLEDLVRLYTAWDKPDEAAQWQQELRTTKPAKKD